MLTVFAVARLMAATIFAAIVDLVALYWALVALLALPLIVSAVS